MGLISKKTYEHVKDYVLMIIIAILVIGNAIFFGIGIAEDNEEILDACRDKAEQVCDNHDMEFQGMHTSLTAILVECTSDCELATYEVNCGS